MWSTLYVMWLSVEGAQEVMDVIVQQAELSAEFKVCNQVASLLD